MKTGNCLYCFKIAHLKDGLCLRCYNLEELADEAKRMEAEDKEIQNRISREIAEGE